jgi:hypothetical protein
VLRRGAEKRRGGWSSVLQHEVLPGRESSSSRVCNITIDLFWMAESIGHAA